MTGLTPNTLYHVRAYATNSVGTSYGADVTFTTLPVIGGGSPNLTASSPLPITATTNILQNFTSTISNIGGVSTGTGFNNFFQVATASNGGGTITDQIASAMSTLSSGGTSSANLGYTFTSDGTYSIRVCADKNSSIDESKIVAVVENGYIYISADSGSSWAPQTSPGSHSWYGVATSLDGSKIAAIANGDYIHTSADGGSTWSTRTGPGSNNWLSIASSSDGVKLAAVNKGGYIYTSTDSGVNWTTQISSGIHDWLSIASSYDGTKLVAVVDGGYIYTSTNSGSSWTSRAGAGSRNWIGVASSSDGTKLVAVVDGGYIYTSTDSGSSWTSRASVRNWYDVASSSDGTKLVAIHKGGYIYTSTNSGISWTSRSSAGSRNWYDVASSSDGTKLVAVVDGGYIYTSEDSGSSWTPRSSAGSRNWYGVASSSGSGNIMESDENDNCSPWVDITVSSIVPTGNISATGCIISFGENSCDTTLNWETFNPTTTSILKTGTTTIMTANSGTTTYAVPYNSLVFNLIHDGVTIKTVTAIAACAVDTHWDIGTSKCELNAPDTTNTTFTPTGPTTIFEGKSITLNWDSPLSTTCTGSTDVGTETFVTGGVKTGSLEVSPKTTTTYTLTCTNDSGSVQKSTIIKVITLIIKEQ
jgi:hypothetical protein